MTSLSIVARLTGVVSKMIPGRVGIVVQCVLPSRIYGCSVHITRVHDYPCSRPVNTATVYRPLPREVSGATEFPPVFAQLTLSPNYPCKLYGLYNAFQSAKHPQKCRFPCCIHCTSSCSTCSLDPLNSASQTSSRSVQPFCTNCTAHGRQPYTLNCAFKRD